MIDIEDLIVEKINWVNRASSGDEGYNRCVTAIADVLEVVFREMAERLGITGYQASCVDLEFTRRNRRLEYFAVQDYGNLLYPQYARHFLTIDPHVWEWLQEKAKDFLQADTLGGQGAHPAVRQHWADIVAGKVPFGLVVDDRRR